MLEIRPYTPADRDAVHAISHLTGYIGEPAGWFWRDRESFAALTTGWYTDHEPGSALVVVDKAGQDKVVGYLLGCLDTSAKRPLTGTVLRHAFGRALLIRPGTAGTLWRGAGDLARGIVAGRGVPAETYLDERFPSHFHVDLLPPARGSGVGRRLVEAFLDRVVAAGSPGCHVETIAQNDTAARFFAGLGFERLGSGSVGGSDGSGGSASASERPLPGWRTRSGERISIVVMTRRLL